MHGIDEGELEIGPLGYYASSLLYWSFETTTDAFHFYHAVYSGYALL